MKLLIRILKRNHQLYTENKLYKRLNLCLIRDTDNAFQRNKKAIDYIDDEMKNDMAECYRKDLMKIREILTTFKTDNVLDEVNRREYENNNI